MIKLDPKQIESLEKVQDRQDLCEKFIAIWWNIKRL